MISLTHVPRLPPLPRLPGVPYVPPMWRESRVGLEARALRHSAIWRGEGVAPGDGRPVLLIPGFLAGDGSLATMTQWLRANGYHTRRAGIRANVSCSETACARLEARLEGFAEAQGRPVTIIGQSRGGIFARALAARRPDLVDGIVTLGSPTVSQLRVHPLVLLQIGLVGALGSGHVPGLFSLRCLRGDCCTRFREALEGPLPVDVRWLALYSRSDGIVDWRACCAPEASELVEVRSTHCGMGLNAGVYEEVARALAITRPVPAGAPQKTALAA
ncbi:MAG: triacylglycerol lipase [Solirubrobacteraceae bacterium]|nr:triacylglycerol lipase [Solirubrobacteraceae bacterium]